MQEKPESPIPSPDEKGGTPPSQPEQAPYNPYNFVADKIGGVPNVRTDDNALQAKIFFAVWVACCLIGSVMGGLPGFWAGALLGMVAALLVSGTVLMIVGLRRKH